MKKVNFDVDAEYEEVFKLDKSIRGPFLLQAIAIDNMVSDIISQHFCPDEDRRVLLFSLILNGSDLTFSGKIEILDKLLHLVYPKLAREHKGIKDRLDKIRRFRNKLAHSMSDSSEEFMSKQYRDRIRLFTMMMVKRNIRK